MKKIRTILVDDMPKARRMLRRMLEHDEEVEIVGEMGTVVEAISYIQENPVDLVFMDIEMPGMTGTEGCHVIGQMENPPLLIFVTAYVDYMAEAWKTEAIYYIVKPFLIEDVQEAIIKYKTIKKKFYRVEEQVSEIEEPSFEGVRGYSMQGSGEARVQVTCFPIFDVKVDGKSVYFKSKRAKEMMAYLVHSRGGWVENADLCVNILEDMNEDKAKNNLRTYTRRLKLTLEEAGAPDVIEQSYGKIRINTEYIVCDYYQYLAGDTHLFKGEYLREYSWAEPAVATMYNKAAKKR